MRLVVDENLSRKWVRELIGGGHHAEHWLDIGKAAAPDREIMRYALEQNAVVLTCDLDFGDILAASGGSKPSVVQLRPDRMRPEQLISDVLRAIKQHLRLLEQGALVTLNLASSRAHVLPLTE
jgi:predicted nuclease of predicted toxin-antitoxin system